MKKRFVGSILAALCLALTLASCSLGSGGEEPAGADYTGSEEQQSEGISAQNGSETAGRTGSEEQQIQGLPAQSGSETPEPTGEDPTAQTGSGIGTAVRYVTAESLGKACGQLAEKLDLSGYSLANLYYSGSSYEFSGTEAEELIGHLKELTCVDAKEIHIYEEFEGWRLNLRPDYEALLMEWMADLGGTDPDMEEMGYEEIWEALPKETMQEMQERLWKYVPIELTMSLTTKGYCVLGPDGICCLLTPEFQKFLAQYREIPEKSAEKNLFSVPYSQEPKTETECRDAAVFCVTKWLEECQKEGTQARYRNKGFKIAEERKNNFVAGGFLDGRREFLVEVCFTAEYDEEATFYSGHEIAHYTKAGTFWEGVYLCARFCWEDGAVSLLTADGSDQYLNGFQTEGYRNFFEYARRSDLEDEIQRSYVPYMGEVVSRNVTVTENGKELNLDIYQRGNIEVRENTVYGDSHFRTYRGDQKYYGTGVYFTDMETSTKYIEYPKSFRLTFDNYTDDGNPDYAILYDTDENGAYYAIESVQSDGRVFNHSGRAYQGGVYVAGCFEPSPRLQRTREIPYIGWMIDEKGKYVPTYGTNPVSLPEINMYSDRLYLPGTQKLYLQGETAVTCFLWNNTEEAVSTQRGFSIQHWDNEEWVTVAEGESEDTFLVAPREYAEITYDLGLIKGNESGRYRIVQEAGKKIGYGEFWILRKEKADVWDVQLLSGTLPEGCLGGRMLLRNIGVVPHKIPEMSLQREDGQEIPIWIDSRPGDRILDTQEEATLNFLCGGEGLAAGKYELTLEGGQKVPFEVKALDQPKAVDVRLRREDQKVFLTVKNLGGEEIEFAWIRLYQLKEGKYQDSYMMVTSGEEDVLTSSGAGRQSIQPGEELQLTMENMMVQMLDDETLKELYEDAYLRDQEGYYLVWEEYNIPEGASYEEFCEAIRKNFRLDENAPLMLEFLYSYGEQYLTGRIKFDNL